MKLKLQKVMLNIIRTLTPSRHGLLFNNLVQLRQKCFLDILNQILEGTLSEKMIFFFSPRVTKAYHSIGYMTRIILFVR